MEVTSTILAKYDVPVPRYTSYPTVPYWENTPSPSQWMDIVKHTFDETNKKEGISLYIHLPFCESLCTYCGCNTRITKNHNVEEKYMDALVREWRMYLDKFGDKPVIRELHLGGGTPTFFSPKNLKVLIDHILEHTIIHSDYEFSFEGHPNNTTKEHLQILYDMGFRRVSYGIQDLDIKVQKTINRVQPFENVERATKEAREIGYQSINFDLIYGLPFQTSCTISDTIQQIAKLRPDRIAYYSYAHVPWVKPGQRSYDKGDLPKGEAKKRLYELGKSLLGNLGYVDIGMDHFSLKGDSLYQSMLAGTLNRNFMGYTTSNSSLLIGLGTSAISDAKYAYGQNAKVVEGYYKQLDQTVPIVKGHVLSQEDLMLKELILDVTCKGVAKTCQVKFHPKWAEIQNRLARMEADGLLLVAGEVIRVTTFGKTLVRNIANAFDLRYHDNSSSKENVFSRGV